MRRRTEQEIPMSSTRKFIHAALLAFTTLNYAPSLAMGQEARGRFTLTHEVHWQSAIVPAGEYRFSFDTSGPSRVLNLSNNKGLGLMVLVPDAEESRAKDMNWLVIQTTPEGSYVSALHLPEFGMTLYFTDPTHAERQTAKAVTTVATPGQ
jgi:hypothetical protein